jgi:peptidyl-prolyl cis-trans isomerase C
MKLVSKLAVFASVIVVLGFSGCDKKDPVVARIGNREVVKLSELNSEANRTSMFERAEQPAPEKYRKALNGLIDKKIKLMAAYRMKMDQDSAIQKIMKPEIQRAMLQRMYDIEIMGPVIPEKQIRDYYAKTAKQVLIRDIVFRLPQPADSAQEDSLRRKAMDVYSRIRKGESYLEMARQYSEDQKTAFNGGLMGVLQYTRSDDPVLDAVFSMKAGEVSKPVRNKAGFHILKVEEVQPKERLPYEKAHDQIRGQIERERRSLLTEKEKQYVDRLREKSGFAWVEPGIDSLLAHFKNSPQFFREELRDSLRRLPESVRTQELARFKDRKKTITTETLIRRLDEKGFINSIGIGSREALMSTIDRWVMTDLLIESAERSGLARHEQVQERTKKMMERLMVDSLNVRVIWGSIQPDPASVLAHYEAFRDSLYSEQPQAQIQEVLVKDRTLAERIMRETESRWDLRRFPEKYSERPGMKQKNGIFDLKPVSQYGELAPYLLKAKRGDTGGPIELKNGQFSVFKVLSKREKTARPFDKVEMRVRQDLVRFIRRDKEKAWLDEQKSKIRVTIDEKILQQGPDVK